MKILYDYQAFSMQTFGGISNCFVQLIKNLPSSVSYSVAINESNNIHLVNSDLVKVQKERNSLDSFLFKGFPKRKKIYDTLSLVFPQSTSLGRNRLSSIKALKAGDFDVFHPTFFSDYFVPYLNGKPFVLTVHDMIPELFFSEKDFQVKKKKILCQKASHIIVVSEKTKRDLMEILNVPESKISVIYHGAPESNYEIESKPIVDWKYILYVGNRKLYKGFMLMMNNLVPVLKRHQDLRIVCTGPSFEKKEIKKLLDMGVKERVFHVSANDAELQNLYAHALCFIYPSLYEGFGIPILEAYKAQCPVLLNHSSCFPEIAQDAALYFHLDNESSDLEQVMEKFLAWGDNDTKNLLRRQFARLDEFSWEKSARKLANVYLSL